jgi:gamma-glutamyl-gamma-aminobutyrate hydrolase PuuD
VKLTAHEVQISAASKTGRAIGAAAKVAAGHRQGINRIGSGLLTVAWTQDQVVEGVELQGHAFGVGVQWHPEEADDLALFEALIAAAALPALPETPAAAGSEPDGKAKASVAEESLNRKRAKRSHARR